MSKSRRLVLRLDAQGIEEEIEGTFEDIEAETLKAFYAEAEQLAATRFLQGSGATSLKIHGTAEGVLNFESTLPPWDDVIVFLHRLRPFILEKEPGSFNRVRGIIARRMPSERLRAILAFLHQIYAARKLESVIKIRFDGKALTSEAVLMEYLNSFEFHRDQDVRKEFEALERHIPREAVQAIVLTTLTEKARAILGLAELVAIIIGAKPTIQVRFGGA